MCLQLQLAAYALINFKASTPPPPVTNRHLTVIHVQGVENFNLA